MNINDKNNTWRKFINFLRWKKEINPPKTFKEKFLYQVKEWGIVLVLFLILNNFLIASFVVPTGSMENEVMTGDFLLVNKFIYGGTSPRNIMFTDVRLPWFKIPKFREVERNDVIVFEFPGNRDEVKSEAFTYYLKRCLALPKDTLQIINRAIYLNGAPANLPRHVNFNSQNILPNNYSDSRIFPPTSPFNEDNYGPIVIPFKGMKINLDNQTIPYWVTFIKREGHKVEFQENGLLIDGVFKNEYSVEQDYLFGIGDNRDNSLDSRYWGFIPKENLVGTPMFVYWSWDTNLPLTNIFGKLESLRLDRVGTIIK
ncbi:MAG: signal peptidase I [Bacteroidetes bacterium]|nr:signal peptidase I [Bacteroidota bacterium]